MYMNYEWVEIFIMNLIATNSLLQWAKSKLTNPE